MIEDVLSISSEFTSLERAVLAAICDLYPTDRAALEAQLSTATVLSRENTGAGFYTRFAAGRGSRARIGGERLRDGPQAKVEGLKHGMGFILWLEEGHAECLEGYSYAESTSNVSLESVGFEVL